VYEELGKEGFEEERVMLNEGCEGIGMDVILCMRSR
jgi:hypothetical protein